MLYMHRYTINDVINIIIFFKGGPENSDPEKGVFLKILRKKGVFQIQ